MKQIIEWHTMDETPPEEVYLLIVIREKQFEAVKDEMFFYVPDFREFVATADGVWGGVIPASQVIRWALLPQPPDGKDDSLIARCQNFLREAADNAEMCIGGIEQDDSERKRARKYRRLANQIGKLGG